MGYWSIVVPQTSDVTNLCTNPSFELNVDGWTPGFDWTPGIRSPGVAFRGMTSLLMTTFVGSADDPVSYAITLAANTVYYISCYVYVEIWGTDDGDIRLGSANYADAEHTYTHTWTNGTDSKSVWHYLETKLTTGSDTSGSIVLESTGTCDSGDIIYIDCVMITATSAAITTFDGDTPGCYWTGAVHASTSVAPALIRNVGEEKNLDDLNMFVIDHSGSGLPGIQHIIDESTASFGAIFRRAKVQPRVLTLMSDLDGTSYANWHSVRKDIVDIIKPDYGHEKFYLRYTGANADKPVELECVYDSGMGISDRRGFTETVGFRVIAYDPFFYEIQDQKVALTTRATDTHDYISAKVSGDWSDLGSTFNDSVYQFAYDEKNDKLYAIGSFDSPFSYIAQYSDGAWSAMGAGLNNYGAALALAPNGDLYVGGTFTDVAGGPGGTYNYIAKWDVSASTWVALGTGMNNNVWDIKIDRAGKVYVAGQFTTGNGVTLNYVGYWNGTTFVVMDNGLSASALCLAIDRSNNVYIGGNFATAGAGLLAVNYITKWSGTAYSALDTGVSANAVRDLAIDNNGILYAGGDFTSASGITVNKIAAWTGSGWYSLDTGVSGGSVYRTIINDNLLWVGGAFTSAGDITIADRLAIWNGSAWVHTDIDLPGTPTVYGIAISDNKQYKNIYLGYTTTGSAVYSVDTTVTNNGSAPAYPILEIWNEGGSSNTSISYLKNETTGSTIWMNYTLQPEEKITINFNPNNFSCISNFVGDASELFLDGSDLNFYLIPGSNIITCFTPDTSVTAGLYWRISHWSSDGVAA